MLQYPQQPGALVISLDLELHWGVRDRTSLDRRERDRLLAAREAAIRIAATLEEFSVHATWATVGFLFARSRESLERFMPSLRPGYTNTRLDPYREKIGRNESEDPFHFAPDLIEELAQRPGQEIATHSFSHYFCREAGQTGAEFEADLRSAIAIAEDAGHSIHSYVFPRNQVNPDYLGRLAKWGISSYRAVEESGLNSSGDFHLQQRPWRRLFRLCDNYFDIAGSGTAPWPSGAPPFRLPASRYLRPYSKLRRGLENLQYQRIAKAMRAAAISGEIFHLWWHPEDFALNGARNFEFLRKVLTFYHLCRDEFGMLSLSMREVAQAADAPAFAPALTMRKAV
jgi:hypothetical protein